MPPASAPLPRDLRRRVTTLAARGTAPLLIPLTWLRDGPVEVARRFLDLPMPLLLESAMREPRHGRWSFLTADPFAVVVARGSSVEIRRGDAVERPAAGPFEALRGLLARLAFDRAPGGPPFQGGIAGYFGYELNGVLERIPPAPLDDLALPDLCVGCYDWVLAWDHRVGAAWLVSSGLPQDPGAARARRAEERAALVLERLAGGARARGSGAGGAPAVAPRYPVPGLPGVHSTSSRDGYLAAVERVREYIRAGDIFQANLSQRLEAPCGAPPFDLYLALRARNPAPFAAYLDLGDAAVVSASPERFLRVIDGEVETRPIKGTAPRGATPAADRALARRLRASRKDRAENVMIVDLLRNDLSIVCEDDSVRVPELCVLEAHPTVHHLVSTVMGRLRAGLGPVDLLRAAFPGGSITGAPKIRAMQIIAELEPVWRGVYTGAIGYLGGDGAMDTSIAIRTFVVKDGRACFAVGGGVVVDSDPESEYAETLAKARGLAEALAAVNGGASGG